MILRDGGHDAREDDAAGLALYTLEFTVDGYVEAREDAIGGAISALHAQCVAALVGQEIATSDQVDAAFDSITYGKGGHVVGMIAGFSVLVLKEPLGWNHAIGFALIAAGAFFVFHGRA